MSAYYAAYARCGGDADPEARRAKDREHWPCGAAAGFILWMSARWQEFFSLEGRRDIPWNRYAYRNEFKTWLDGLPVGHGFTNDKTT